MDSIIEKTFESWELTRLVRAAKRIGAEVVIEPEWKRIGKIRFSNGSVVFFRVGFLDVNSNTAALVAKDKHFSAFFLKEAGYPSIKGQTFFSDAHIDEHPGMFEQGEIRKVEEAVQYANELGYPVVVKPNGGAQGRNVFFVHTDDELRAGLEKIFTTSGIALVQEKIGGRDYRVLVHEGNVVAAYERTPLNVTGDGIATIASLLEQKMTSKNKTLDTGVLERVAQKLAKNGMTPDTILEAGQTLFLLDNANLSTGGDSTDVTEHLHPEFAEIARGVAQTMSLKLAGIDLMIEGDIADAPATYHVVEVNAVPGIGNFAKSGAHQEQRVEDVYETILRGLEKDAW